MFDSMHNGWAERDYAHYRNEERYEAREAMRDEYHDAIVSDLIAIGRAYGKNARTIGKTERQQCDEAMESVFDWIFSNPAKQTLFETALLQIWATYRCKEDSPAVPGVLIFKKFFRLIRTALAKNILKNHGHKNKRAGIAEDSPMSRLANVIDYGMTAFASQKAQEKYQ